MAFADMQLHFFSGERIVAHRPLVIKIARMVLLGMTKMAIRAKNRREKLCRVFCCWCFIGSSFPADASQISCYGELEKSIRESSPNTTGTPQQLLCTRFGLV